MRRGLSSVTGVAAAVAVTPVIAYAEVHAHYLSGGLWVSFGLRPTAAHAPGHPWFVYLAEGLVVLALVAGASRLLREPLRWWALLIGTAILTAAITLSTLNYPWTLVIPAKNDDPATLLATAIGGSSLAYVVALLGWIYVIRAATAGASPDDHANAAAATE